MSKKEVFSNVLSLMRAEAKKFQLLLKLVESLAWEDVEEKTIANHEKITEWIPWDFVPNKKDYKFASKKRVNKAKYENLKMHVEAIQKILEDAKCV